MNRLKILAVTTALVMVLGATTITAFAGTAFSSPAELLASLTGKTVETVTEEKLDANQTYGALAQDAGVYEGFKSGMQEVRENRILEKIENGNLTKDEANEILDAIEERMATCDGTGLQGKNQRLGLGYGIHMGSRNGENSGNGEGNQWNREK
jgi:hypothetical protein